MRPIPILIVKVVIEAPVLGHAEIVVRPRPAPSEVSTTDKAKAANAPAKIAGQLTAEDDASLPAAEARSLAGAKTVSTVSARSAQEG